jgi:hypothetical protein
MTLSERLQEARTRRLIEAGVLSHEHALKPEPAPKAEPPAAEETSETKGLFEPITIEVQPSGLHLVTAPSELTDIPEGDATPNCPNCNALGRLDMVDLVGHTRHFTCERCGTMWQVRSSVSESAAP